MFLEKVTVKDFKHIEYVEEDFSKINVFSGKNGQGKSSLFEAIILILSNHTEEKLQEYIRWKKKKFFIKAVFTHLTSRYEYSITCTKSKTDRELIINGDEDSKIVNSDAVVYISENILDPTITLASNISIQHKGTELLFEKPTPRFNKFKKIFKISQSEKIAESLKSDMDKLKEDNQKLTTELNIFNSFAYELEEVPETPTESLEVLEKSFKESGDNLKTYEDEKITNSVYGEKLRVYTEGQEELKVKISEKKTFEDLISLKEKEIVSTPEVYNDSLLQSIKDNYNSLVIEYSKVESERDLHRRVKTEISNNEEKIEKLQSEISEIFLSRLPSLDFTEKDIDSLVEGSHTNGSLLKNLREKIVLAKQGKCPTCSSIYSGASVDDLIIEETKLEEKIKVVSEEVQTKKESLKVHTEIKQKNSIYEATKKSLQDQLGEVQATKVNLDTDLEKISFNEVDMASLQVKIGNLSKEKEAEEIKQNKLLEVQKSNKLIEDSISSTKLNLHSITDSIVNLNSIEKPKEFSFTIDSSIVEIHDSNRSKIEIFNSIKRDIDRVVKANLKVEKDQKENLDKIKKIKKSMEKNNKDFHICEDTRQLFLKNFPSFCINRGTNYIKQKMNEFFARAYGKYNINFENDGKGISFYYQDLEDNIDKNVNLLSGWEKHIYANSFRMALISLQPDIGIFMGDEIDSDADDGNSLRMYKTLLNENLSQFFFITHKEETKEYLENLEEATILKINKGKIA